MQKVELGAVTLTFNQMRELSSLHDANVKGIQIVGGVAYANTVSGLDAGQVSALLSQIQGLPDVDSAQEQARNVIRGKDKGNLSQQDVQDIVVALAEIAGLL